MANEYFSRTPSVAGNRRTFTFSCWFKRIKTGSGGSNRNDIFAAGNTASVGAGGFHFWFIDDQLRIESDGGSLKIVSNNLYRDISQAYHLLCRVDTTQSDANNRLRMYVNGNLVALSANSQPSQNYQYQVNNTTPHYIGVGNDDNVLSYYAGGVMSDAFFVDGQSLDPSVFGRLSSKGQWTPKHSTNIKSSITSSGGFGTNGFYLPFGSNIGYDQSGLGNNYTANNFDLNIDFSSKDTISNNFCVLNKLSFIGSHTLSDGGLRMSGGNDGIGSIGVRSGKWYWEMKRTNTGVTPHTGITATWGNNGEDWLLNNSGMIMCRNDYGDNAANGFFSNTNGISSISSELGVRQNWDNGDILTFHLDLNSSPRTFKIYKNSSTGTPILHRTFNYDPTSSIAEDIFPYCRNNSGSETLYNFGQGSFVNSNNNNGYSDSNNKGKFQYQPPTGFLALCEDNLTDATIIPKDHFDVLTYTGTSSAQTITGLNFKPSLLWNISRASSSGYYPALYDDIRGPNNAIFSNTTNSNTSTSDGSISAFNSNGFSLNSGGGYGNSNGGTYVVHAWKGGDSVVTNTNGTRSSQVSVNVNGGFSVVNFSIASGSGEDTIGHGLGVKPDVIMMKSLNNTYNWDVWHKGLGSITNTLILNEINYVYTNRQPFTASTEPTANVFSIRNAFYGAGTSFTAYCWKEISGYSKFGRYYGSNTTNFIHTGFRPAFVMIRPFTGGSNTTGWRVFDYKRNPYNLNGSQNALYWERGGTNNEVSQNGIDFMSNGFSLISASDANYNASGTTYIYMAFAEMPGDLANAR